MADQSPHAGEMTQEEIHFHELLRMLTRMNNALDYTVYLLAENHADRCFQIVRELLRLVVKIDRDIDDIIRHSPYNKTEFSTLAQEHVAAVAASQTKFFNSVQTDPKLFEKANEMMHRALDAIDSEYDDAHHLILEGPPENRIICLTQPPQEEDFVDGICIDARVNGALVEFTDDDPMRIQLYEDGELLYGFEFEPGGESGNLEIEEKPGSIIPLVGSAALLAAAFVLKTRTLLPNKTSSSQPVTKKKQIESKEFKNASAK